MRAAVFHGKNDLRVQEVEKRAPLSNEVVIKVLACGVCGTDLHIYEGAEGSAKCDPPKILGHEFSGIVHEVGSGVKSFKPGDRVCVDPNDMCGGCYYCRTGREHFCENMVGIGVTVNGGFAEYCTVQEKQVYGIGETLSFEEGAMAEPIACCLHGMDLTGVKTGNTVMIIGGGTIGQIMLQLARLSGASTLIMVEPVAEKRETALKLGADLAIDPLGQSVEEVLAKHSVKYIDAAVECVGLKDTMQNALKYVTRGGTVMMFGLTNPACEIPLMPFDVFKREIAIKASFINPYTQQRAVSLLQAGRLNVRDLITDKVPLSDIKKVFDDKAYRKRGKVLIIP